MSIQKRERAQKLFFIMHFWSTALASYPPYVVDIVSRECDCVWFKWNISTSYIIFVIICSVRECRNLLNQKSTRTATATWNTHTATRSYRFSALFTFLILFFASLFQLLKASHTYRRRFHYAIMVGDYAPLSFSSSLLMAATTRLGLSNFLILPRTNSPAECCRIDIEDGPPPW